VKTIEKKAVRVEDIACLLEQIAPARLAQAWDNCGLQVGSFRWEVKKIWVALDPLDKVIEDAGQSDVDMVITHHPLIFKGLKRVEVESTEGKAIASAINHRIAVYSAHTNLDSAVGGINDVLAQKIGLCNLQPMIMPSCSSGSDEASGDSVMAGIGRIGNLLKPLTAKRLIGEIKRSFGIQHVKAAGNIDRIIHRAAVCSGSGGSLMDTFLSSDADVFITGDLRYHDARAVEDAGRVFIDIGHFASEHIILDALTAKLKTAVQKAGWDVKIETCMIEKDPFKVI
jgi:dinuclear metal center YbgI/SA1388 family protein